MAKGTYQTGGISFEIIEGITLQGNGASTVLSGETGNEGADDNCYHVVIGAGCTFDHNYSSGDGGAVCTDDTASQFGQTSPTFDRCTFSSNTATKYGGALANYNKCSPQIIQCVFSGNRAKSGGAISNRLRVDSNITQCDYVSASDTVFTSD